MVSAGGDFVSQPDWSRLPIRKQPFGGVANRTLGGSQPDWAELGHVEPPDGAPNMPLVLIDDAGSWECWTFVSSAARVGEHNAVLHADRTGVGQAGRLPSRWHMKGAIADAQQKMAAGMRDRDLRDSLRGVAA